MEKKDNKMKKILLPIIIVLAVLSVVFIALTVAVRVTGGHSSKSKKGEADTSVAVEETTAEEADYVTGYELDGYSSNGQPADSADATANLTERMSDANGYILATSDTAELTDADLQGLTAQELTYARNEIYARHGYVFDSSELNDYFATKSWYTADDSFDGNSLSALEQQNAEFIRTYQTNNNLGYEVK